MIALLLSAQFMLGSISWAPDPGTLAALQKRGLSTRIVDFPMAMEEAFAKGDTELFRAMAKDMEWSSRADYLADQVIRLYEAQPEDDFKKSIAVPLACSLQFVERVMQSRWTCRFYASALTVLFSGPPEEDRANVVILFETLSKNCGLTLSPYFVKAALVVPDDQIILGEICLERLEKHWSFVTPAMAYHILQRYACRPDRIPNEKVYTPIRERAKSLLEAKQLPVGSSREDVLKQLDTIIEAEGKKLCEKYGHMEYKPTPPSPPNSPDKLLE